MECTKSLSLVCLLLAAPAFAQVAPAIEWERCLGGSSTDIAFSVAQTSDGGYIVAGDSYSTDGDVTNNHGGGDYWVVKLGVTGDLLWEKCLGGSYADYGYSIAQTYEGGYILAGSAHSTNGDVSNNHGVGDYWLVKLDATGSLQWQKCLGGSNNDAAFCITQTSDSGYIVAGNSSSTGDDVSNNHGGYDYWVVKLNALGSLQWEKSLGGSEDDLAYSIVQASDGGYVVAGYSYSTDGNVGSNHGGTDYWVVKLDTAGNVQWRKSLGGSSLDQAKSIAPTIDGGYVVAGFSYSTDGDVTNNHGDQDYWVAKLDAAGSLQWEKSFGGSSVDQAESIAQSSDGGYLVAGSTRSGDEDVTNHQGFWYDYWVVKLDAGGSLQWEKSLGGTYFDYGRSIAQTSDGGYIVAGSSQSTDGDVTNNHGGDGDYWVVKLGPAGVGIREQSPAEFTCSPNPAHGVVRVTNRQALRNTTLTLTDALGREVLHASMRETSVELDLNAIPAGLYVLTGIGDQAAASQRLVVE